MRLSKIFCLALLFCSLQPMAVRAEEKIKIVATLSSFADLARTVGGEHVEVASIASPRFNPHFIEAKPSDVFKLKRADLYLHSGLDLEAWSGPLVDAAARPELRKGGERQLDLSQGIELLEVPQGQVSRAEGDIHLMGNPHYWLDPRNASIIASTIEQKLESVDAAHAEDYRNNLAKFKSDLAAKIMQWQSALKPYEGKKLVGYHNEWVYLMKFSGLSMDQFLEAKPGIPPTPGQIATLISYVKQQSVKAIVQATYYSTEAAEQVVKASGGKVVTICQNVHEIPDAKDYLTMIDYNISHLLEALRA